MWKYLERILGKPSQYYENLMRTRDSKIDLSRTTIDDASSILTPLIKPGFKLQLNSDKPEIAVAPKNKRKLEIPYFGKIEHPEYALYLFFDNSKFLNDESNISLIVEKKKHNGNTRIKSFQTLPIWEELIHYNSIAHHGIVELSGDHPWTLYRTAKKELVGTPNRNQVSGYPQWLVNNIDFRKIAAKEFLFQMELPGTEMIIYYFKSAANTTAEFFIQKL
ncbi:hypothetical protein [Nonlabens antarcticus]|uniref:hypothetical protein n=1 Tax=Nonlabens antarcticus TaxID=392714 RepID=UPI001890C89A|nr:hypothetical protein [Nonlabens antarcticus]